ncbi:TPA: hypothetical protein R1756_001654 [Campylobacter jejuni]|nr:hypothetical protein [Campylobacter jejuni]
MKRNNFNLSNYKLFTGRMGRLYPIGMQEVIPGDTFRVQTQALIRLSPMLAPIMHPIKVRIHHWYVPFRILYDKWEEFIVNPDSGISLPYGVDATIQKGTLHDYLGIWADGTTSPKPDFHIMDMPVMAYWLIWNEFYRDEILQEPIDMGVSANGAITFSPYDFQSPAFIAWNKDRFTSSRPFTQIGEQVFVPVYSDVGHYNWTTKNYQVYLRNRKGDIVRGVGPNCPDTTFSGWIDPITKIETLLEQNKAKIMALGSSEVLRLDCRSLSGCNNRLTIDWCEVTCTESRLNSGVNEPTYNTILYSVKMKNPTAAGYMDPNYSIFTIHMNPSRREGSLSVRDLRLSSALQRFKENRAKWGNRYIEYLNYLGIKSSDARLQLPEYLGGGSQLLQTSEVLQTAPSDTDGVVGSMKGHGIGAVKSNRFTRFFEEHGVILTLFSVQPISIYAQGCPRFLMKNSWSDFFQKDLQDIGMQEVYNGELYFSGVEDVDYQVFGYQDRYDEYRRGRSSIAGDFHDTLDFWHLARKFKGAPVLNDDFIKCNPSMRIFADTTSDPLWVMCKHNVVAKRPISKRASSKLK